MPRKEGVFEIYPLQQERFHVARKPFACYSCGKEIAGAEEYYCHSAKYRFCLHCVLSEEGRKEAEAPALYRGEILTVPDPVSDTLREKLVAIFKHFLDRDFSPEEQTRFVLCAGVVLSYGGLRRTSDVNFYVSLRDATPELEERVSRFIDFLQSEEDIAGFFDGHILRDVASDRQAFLLHVMGHFLPGVSEVSILPFDRHFCCMGPDGIQCTTLQFDIARRILRVKPWYWCDAVAYILKGGVRPVPFPPLPDVIALGGSGEATKNISREEFINQMLFYLASTYGIEKDKKEIMKIIS